MWAQIEKSHDLGKDVLDCNRAEHQPARNKGKEPITLVNVDTLVDNELSLGNSPPLSISQVNDARGSAKAKSRKRPSHHLAFSDSISGTSRRARREAGRR